MHRSREVWVASICQVGLGAKDPEGMVKRVLTRMEEVAPMRPDIVCLPEAFPFVGLEGGRPSASEVNVRIKHVEAWAAIESLSPDVSIPDVLTEFGIETSNDMLDRNTRLQDEKRPS